MLLMFRQFIDNPRAGRTEPSLPLPKARRSARPFGAHDARIPKSLRMDLVRCDLHRPLLLSELGDERYLVNKDFKEKT